MKEIKKVIALLTSEGATEVQGLTVIAADTPYKTTKGKMMISLTLNRPIVQYIDNPAYGTDPDAPKRVKGESDIIRIPCRQLADVIAFGLPITEKSMANDLKAFPSVFMDEAMIGANIDVVCDDTLANEPYTNPFYENSTPFIPDTDTTMVHPTAITLVPEVKASLKADMKELRIRNAMTAG